MAVPKYPIPASYVETVKALLQPNLPVVFPGPEGLAAASLRESFPLHTAGAEELIAAHHAGRTLESVCGQTGIWHHQLQLNGEVKGFARTTAPEDPGGAQFLSLMDGRLAHELDRTIQAVDHDSRFESNDYTAILVLIPMVAFYFLLLSNGPEEWVVIACSMFGSLGLAPLTVLSAGEFVDRLRRLPERGGVQFQDRP
ncbi:MAG TPA: hypothetical protein VKU19_14015 [Bryobacteraceae bacterium]|nr:hypothetical protein [Bryobacteraceae bacterium]